MCSGHGALGLATGQVGVKTRISADTDAVKRACASAGNRGRAISQGDWRRFEATAEMRVLAPTLAFGRHEGAVAAARQQSHGRPQRRHTRVPHQ